MARRQVFGVLASGMVVAGMMLSAAWAAERKGLSKADLLLVGAQKICPISGKDLKSMGGPIKAEARGLTVYLCCKGCSKALERKPQRALAKVAGYLLTSQKLCPVTNEPLGRKAIPVVVKKRAVFVCCKGCIAKVKADPKRHIARVDAMLKKNLPTKKRK